MTRKLNVARMRKYLHRTAEQGPQPQPAVRAIPPGAKVVRDASGAVVRILPPQGSSGA